MRVSKMNKKNKLGITLILSMFLIMVFVLMFIALPQTARNFEDATNQLGISLLPDIGSDTTPLVADAWEPPNNGKSHDFVSQGSGLNPYPSTTIYSPDNITSPGTAFNKASYFKNFNDTSDTLVATMGTSPTAKKSEMRILHYRDYVFSEEMLKGIKNDLIDSITYKMTMKWTLGYLADGGDINQHVFISLGTCTSAAPTLTNYTTKFQAYTVVVQDVKSSSNNALNAEMTVTLNRGSSAWKENLVGTVVMRVGYYVHVDVPSVPYPTVDFQNPTATHLSMSWTKPKLLVNISGTDNNGTLETVGGTNYMTQSTTVSNFINQTMKFTAKSNAPSGFTGYYFAGWSAQIDGISKKALEFTINGAYEIPRAGITITAHFKSYSISTTTSFVFTQELSGGAMVGVKQGPDPPSGNLKDSDGANYFTAYALYAPDAAGATSSKNKPSDAGSYVIKVNVRQTENGTTYNNVEHEVKFSITPLPVGDVNLSSGTYTYDGTNKSYTGGVRLAPNSFSFLVGSKSYKMSKDTDYTIEENAYVGDWVNATNSQYLKNNPEFRPGIRLAAKGNFSGIVTAFAEINPININQMTLGDGMAEEISLRYDTTYTGFDIIPEVILVRLKYLGNEFTLIAYDPLCTDTTRRNLYGKHYKEYGDIYREVEGQAPQKIYDAFEEYLGPTSTWVSGFFALQVNTYSENKYPSSSYVPSFKINMVRLSLNGANGYQNFVDDHTDKYKYSDAEKTITFNLPKRDVNDQYNNDANDVTIISDYSSLTGNLPYVTPIIYNGEMKDPKIFYVLIKVKNVKLWTINYQGTWYWDSAGVAFFSLTNSSNGLNDPAPPETFYYGGTEYTVNYAGTFDAYSVQYTHAHINNVDVACGGIVTMSASAAAYVEGDFQLTFEIGKKDLSLDPDLEAGGGYINAIANQTYNFGAQITPSITAIATKDASDNASEGRITLIEGHDYTIEYQNNTGITQTATVILTGMGNYKGIISQTFRICARDITNDPDITIKRLADVVYNGTKYSSTNEELIVYDGQNRGYTIPAAHYLIKTAGTNLNTYSENYFDIEFKGVVASSSSSEAGAEGSSIFAGIKRVGFTILPKNLNLESITKVATWKIYDLESVTYNGEAKTGLPIVTTGTTKTVIIRDTIRNVELVFSGTGAAGDYMLATEGAWGTNPNAGTTSGSVKFVGIRNYTGEIVVPFEIVPKDISSSLTVTLNTGDSSQYNQDLQGFYFTGGMIEPGVMEVKDGPNVLGVTDYVVGYGSSTDAELNVFVKKGGVTIITGVGNYAGDYIRSFKILPINQKVIFVDPLTTDADVKVESIATAGHKYYADYEINADILQGREIVLKAKTTAIYPSARLITFTATPLSATIRISNVEYISCLIEEEDGIFYSVTTAKITVSSEDRYGRIQVKAEQYDSETGGLGNYSNCEYSPSNPNNNTAYQFFMKRGDGFKEGFSYANGVNKTYGNDNFEIARSVLSSYLNSYPNIYSYITLTSTDDDIVEATVSGSDWNVRIKNAGECKLILEHSGYITADTDSAAYLPFTKEISVTINKRNLEISCRPKDMGNSPIYKGAVATYYGTAATFEYIFRTWATGDSHTGLSYGTFADYRDDIMTGMIINYDSGNAHKQSTIYFENGQEKNAPHSITVALGTPQSRGANYTITSAAGELTVMRKKLTASIWHLGQTNAIIKDYGSANPLVTNILYEGWVSGENISYVSSTDPTFTPPTLQYGEDISEGTDVGTYTNSVKLLGGKAKNYEIPEVLITCIIVAVSPKIELEAISDSFKAAFIGYPYEYLDYSGNSMVKQASILAVNEYASIPQEGYQVTYQYKYEEQAWTSEKPRRAGTYSTRVSYAAKSGDNYKDTTKEFVNNIVISKVAPTISLALPIGQTQYELSFTGESVDVANIQPIVMGVGSDRPSGGTVVIKFRLYGYSTWENTAVNAGVYDLQISFIASPTDNYTSNSGIIFGAALVIKDGIVNIVLQAGCRMIRDFDGQPHEFDITKVKFLGSPTDLDENGYQKEIPGVATVYYSLDAITWSTEPPTKAGNYVISINFKPDEGTDYDVEGNSMAFSQYNGQDLFVINKKDIRDFMKLDLNAALRLTYNANYQVIPANNPPYLEKLPYDTVGPTGTISVGYQLSGVSSAPIIASVKDVGTYDVILQYTEGVNDNYKYTVPQRIQARFVVEPAQVTISFASTENYFYYSGEAHRVSVSMLGVAGETPRGTLLIEYKLREAETFTTSVPVNAGTYDMRVSYQQRIDVVENYAATSVRRNNIIVINKIAPIIIINDMILENGEIDENFIPDVVLKGASQDLVGPPRTNTDGTLTLSFEYAVFLDGKYVWSQWTSQNYPTNSGKYSLRATFSPAEDTNSPNYTVATTVKYLCIEIKNISPKFSFTTMHVYYTGKAISSPSVEITNIPAGLEPQGKIAYEYKKQGTVVWRNSAPQEVGVYDIRIRYTENSKGDSFSSFSQIIDSAITIEALPITIVPLVGQGNIYGSKATASSEIIYSYMYELDGFTYYVYPKVMDKAYGESVDVSTSEYVAADGFVYDIDMVGGTAYRDYAWDHLSVLKAKFSYNTSSGAIVEEVITENVGIFNTSSRSVEFAADSGREYILDLENYIVKHKNQYDNFTFNYEVKPGYFFSIENANGSIENIEIVKSRVQWLNNEDKSVGNIDIVRSGSQIRYRVNFNTMKVSLGSREYDLKLFSGYITYSTDGNVTRKTILIDEDKVFAANLQTNSAFYRAIDGYVYEIFFGEEKVVRWYPIKIERVSFNFDFKDPITSSVEERYFEVDVLGLLSLYSYDMGVYSYIDPNTGQRFIINLDQMIAQKDLRYVIKSSEAGDYFEYRLLDGEIYTIYLNSLAYIPTETVGVYLYKDIFNYYYYVDTNEGYVRSIENRVVYSLRDSKLQFTQGENNLEVDVDYHNLYFNTYNGNMELSRRIRIFGQEFDFSSPSLVADNVWIGSLKAQLGGAGSYLIEIGNLAAGSNYVVTMSFNDIKYSVDKAPLYITFEGPASSVYDGSAKEISYEVFGLLGSDTKDIIGLIETLEGDNVSVTFGPNGGFRLILAIDPLNSRGVNYYFTNNASSSYYITPAQMEKITFTPIKGGITYDGARHELKLTEIDPDVTVLYNGSRTIPTYKEPGTYQVKALVQKENYISQEVDLTLTINKGLFTIVPDAMRGTYYYGDSMPTLTTDSEMGYIKFMSGQKLHPSITEYHWEFVPFSENFYDYYQGLPENGYLVKGKINLVVMKATPTVQISGQLVQSETSLSALLPLINGKSQDAQEINIFFKGADGSVYTSLPSQPGKYTVVVEYEGDEIYEGTTFETTLTIEPKSNYTWLLIAGGIIIGLALLSALFFLIRKPKVYV